MRRTYGMISQRFGKLTVIDQVKSRRNQKYWLCLCDCGILKEIRGSHLRSGHSTSCGCTNSRHKNLSGSRIAYFQVVSKIAVEDMNNNKRGYYLCQCDCGKEFVRRSSDLNSTLSCGCKRVPPPIMFGPTNPSWKGGYSDDIRKTPEYYAWRKKILSAKQCRCCADTQSLEAHHIFSIDKNPDKITSEENGCCLCQTCHQLFHLEYGYGNNNLSQLEEFLKNFAGV